MIDSQPGARWLVFTWRLPSGSSTPRVMLWRSLRRLGASVLTPGAAILPFRENLQEQLDWLAQEVEEAGGVGWVLPVLELNELEERTIRQQMNADRQEEYQELKADAAAFLERTPAQAGTEVAHAVRFKIEKELVALQRRFRKIRDRDYFEAPSRGEAARTIDRCLGFRQGISSKLTPVTDAVAS